MPKVTYIVIRLTFKKNFNVKWNWTSFKGNLTSVTAMQSKLIQIYLFFTNRKRRQHVMRNYTKRNLTKDQKKTGRLKKSLKKLEKCERLKWHKMDYLKSQRNFALSDSSRRINHSLQKEQSKIVHCQMLREKCVKL